MNQSYKGLAVIKHVSQKVVNKKDGSGSFTLFIVDTSLGEMSTTKKDLAESAWSLVNQSVEVEYAEKQVGDYTNRYLNGILPAQPSPAVVAQRAQEAHPALAAAAGIPQTPQAPTEAPSAPHAQIPSGDAERTTQIQRQVATKVAAQLGAADFWDNVQALVAFYETGSTHAPQQQQTAVPAGGGFDSPPPWNDDSIPF